MKALESYFAHRGWPVLDFQREAWKAWEDGESGLIHAPTGSGKTLAAWGGPSLALLEGAGPGPRMLWLTPLRALAADTARALDRPLRFHGLEDAVGLRTGDTSAYRKKKLMERPPPALVTTPESLSVMLSYADAGQRLSRLEGVVVDEWHELVASKRGVLLQLSLARLRALNPGLRVWGLSATLGNLDEAARALMAPGVRPRIIAGRAERPVALESLLPDEVSRFPWAGRVGIRQLQRVVEAIDGAGSSLLFTNTRSQAEIWFNAISSVCPWPDRVALHHGSIDRELRDAAERGLAEGRLKCVVATSSLDLGVDFSPVDQVLQVGSPKGIARLIQRAGRSGHRPGGRARIICVPTHALEIVELAAVRERLRQGGTEARRSIRLALDVLAQHLVTIATGGGFRARAMFEEVRETDAFRELDAAAWQWVLDFVMRGGPALHAYPDFRRVVEEDGVCRVPDRRTAVRHRMNIGTITADGAMQVKFQRGGSLGSIEERFLTRLRPGDRFVFAGRILELVRIRDMTAWVRSARVRKATVPTWQGGRLPLSTLLADGMLALFQAHAEGRRPTDNPEFHAAEGLLELQRRWSALPTPHDLLVESARSRDGHHWFVFPFAGRLAHEGLAALVAWRLAQRRPVTFSITVNDYGFELLSADAVPLDERAWRDALSPDRLHDDILASMNAASMARHRFRDIARIAGLVQQGPPGRGKSLRHLQSSSGLIFDVLIDHDPGNRLLEQARREVLEAQLEIRRIDAALRRAARQRLAIHATERFSPLAFPLWADRLRARLSSEDWQARVERMLGTLERAARRPAT
ncbi:MAG: ligase-associated DNA damage response DEXH box helicase [Wenzhouxiangellaceae bacterium]|nr:ligase-associated DNA damage response DEXH box helicase [Wenzhouxiangellaceae bacterium]